MSGARRPQTVLPSSYVANLRCGGGSPALASRLSGRPAGRRRRRRRAGVGVRAEARGGRRPGPAASGAGPPLREGGRRGGAPGRRGRRRRVASLLLPRPWADRQGPGRPCGWCFIERRREGRVEAWTARAEGRRRRTDARCEPHRPPPAPRGAPLRPRVLTGPAGRGGRDGGGSPTRL